MSELAAVHRSGVTRKAGRSLRKCGQFPLRSPCHQRQSRTEASHLPCFDSYCAMLRPHLRGHEVKAFCATASLVCNMQSSSGHCVAIQKAIWTLAAVRTHQKSNTRCRCDLGAICRASRAAREASRNLSRVLECSNEQLHRPSNEFLTAGFQAHECKPLGDSLETCAVAQHDQPLLLLWPVTSENFQPASDSQLCIAAIPGCP